MFNSEKVDQILLSWAANEPRIEDFTIDQILTAIGASSEGYKEVLKYLMDEKKKIIIPKKLLFCPSNDPVRGIPYEQDFEELELCHICGQSFSPTEDDWVLVFDFTDAFREYAKSFQRTVNKLIKNVEVYIFVGMREDRTSKEIHAFSEKEKAEKKFQEYTGISWKEYQERGASEAIEDILGKNLVGTTIYTFKLE